MAYNGNRYANDPRFKLDTSRLRHSRQDQEAERKARESRNGKQTWGNIAQGALPLLGGIAGGALGTFVLPGLGTAAGASLGAGLGGAAGQAVSQGLYNSGEEDMDPIKKREMERIALMQAIMSMPRR